MPVFRRTRTRVALLAGVAACAVALLAWTLFRDLAAPISIGTPSGGRDGPAERHVRTLMSSAAPLEDRFAALFHYFLEGFERHAEPGFARVHYSGYRGWSGHSVDGLEGFARTGTLLAAWIASGRELPRARWAATGQAPAALDMLRSGILLGTDPRSRYYWGDIRDDDQRIVEAADVARILWLTRHDLWERLDSRQRQMIGQWLLAATARRTQPNNWMLFSISIASILAQLPGSGVPEDLPRRTRERFERYLANYLDDGWFADPPHGVDFYNTWGITYELFWIHRVDPGFEPERLRQLIRQSADLTQYLIGPGGIPIMGRSICYRTAVPVPLLAASFLDEDDLAAGKALRALDVVWRYFVAHGALSDGALTQGYFASDPRLLDNYTGTGGCQWGLRSLVLAFMHSPSDRFWKAPQVRLPVEQGDYRIDVPKLGWLVEGHHATGEIAVVIARNELDRAEIDPYTGSIRLQEILRRKPLRPSNLEAKYKLRRYSSAAPFALQP